MEDWKKKLEKAGSPKVCKDCKGPLKDPKFTYCLACNKKHSPSAGLPADYLIGGYFNAINDKNYIKEEVFMRWAKDTSTALREKKMTAAAIRRFFSKLRAIEYKYKMTHDFELARVGLYSFPSDASYTENRRVTPPLFTEFIEKNIAEAKKDTEHFRAFVEHFKCVIAYFKEDKKGA